jgi:teichuronic acid biosynthesis glycosyltransferase TuaH
MMATRDLLVFGTHPFASAVPLGDWQLTRALARHHRVLWVDPPAAPRPSHRRGAAGTGSSRRPVAAGHGLVVGSPLVPTGRPLPPLGPLVERLVTAQVNRWTRLLDMGHADAISFAPRLGALRGLRRRRLAAWLKDRDWAAAGVHHQVWIRDRQAQLIRAADVVTAVSAPLVADCRDLDVDAFLIPNGCDVAAYETAAPEPPRMRDLPRPRIVFAGAWNERVDIALVERIAALLPAASIVLIGAVSTTVPAGANVHVLGPIAHDALAAHLRAADVGIIPYRSTPFNDASCPLKLYEYLAAGLPVVASAVDVAPVEDADVVRRLDDADGFADAVAALGRRDVRARCTALAADHTWDARANALLGALDAADERRTR